MSKEKKSNQSGNTMPYLDPVKALRKRQKAEKGKIASKLEKIIERLEVCITKRENPAGSLWPTREEYTGITNLVRNLDPVPKRKRHNPFWKCVLASVDGKQGPKAIRGQLRVTISSFVKYAEDHLSQVQPPQITKRFHSVVRNQPGGAMKEQESVERVKKIMAGKKVELEESESLVPLSSQRFQKLWKKASFKIPGNKLEQQEVRGFVEYAAALDIASEHRRFVKNSLWIEQLADFLRSLENTGFDSIEKKLKECSSMIATSSEMYEANKREHGKNRKRRQRAKGKIAS